MKNFNRKTQLFSGIILFALGVFLAVAGTALLIISILDGTSELVGQIIVCLVMLGLGITLIVLGGKKIYLRIRQSATVRYGKETTAKITDFRTVSYAEGRGARFRYAFVLFYNDGASDKTFTTDFIYDINEYRYLTGLEKVKIRFDKNFVAISEPLPKEIYKVDSDYGVDLKFFKQKKIKILFAIWAVLFAVALSLLIASIVVGNGTAILATVIFAFGIHGPFMLALAIFLIQWYSRK